MDTYKAFKGKVIIEYGKSIRPLEKLIKEGLKHVNASSRYCTPSCVENCLRRQANTRCLKNTCQCHFRINATHAAKKNWTRRFHKAAKIAHDKQAKAVYEALAKLKPALKAFRQTVKALKRQTHRFIKKVLVKVYGCQKPCVKQCFRNATKGLHKGKQVH